MPKTPQRVDIDPDMFPDTAEQAREEFVVVGPIFGRDWKILTGINYFTALSADEDPSKYVRLIVDAIHPDERRDFLAAIQNQKSLADPAVLLNLANAIVGAAAGNPQTSSGGSSPGTPRKAAARRSVAK